MCFLVSRDLIRPAIYFHYKCQPLNILIAESKAIFLKVATRFRVMRRANRSTIRVKCWSPHSLLPLSLQQVVFPKVASGHGICVLLVC